MGFECCSNRKIQMITANQQTDCSVLSLTPIGGGGGCRPNAGVFPPFGNGINPQQGDKTLLTGVSEVLH